MANTILITANWHTGALSQQTISMQYDNNRYAVQFVGYPEASDDNELDYYLPVWMSSAPGEKPDEIAPIQLRRLSSGGVWGPWFLVSMTQV